MTRAPAALAMRSARSDTPPVPMRSTLWPRSSGRTPFVSAFHAVTPAHGSVAASSKLKRAGELHDARFRQRHVVGEHPLGGRTAERCAQRRRRRPREPALEEAAGDPVPGRECPDPGTDGVDHPGPVRQRDACDLDGAAEIVPPGDGLITEVERGGAHAHPHLPGRRIRARQLEELELLYGSAPRRQLPRAHLAAALIARAPSRCAGPGPCGPRRRARAPRPAAPSSSRATR